ncbi:hypothetical protein K4F52_003310 [Lecanicillium sp. MT-2017a]|nr:hypothetical protein K4F52_003310 [Lecanicillium sp. MT-2017a]
MDQTTADGTISTEYVKNASTLNENASRDKALAYGGRDDQSKPPSPPPKPSGTFSIDFAVPRRQEVDENFETLRTSHMAFIDNLFPDCSEAPAASPAVPPPKLPPPASASPAASSSTNSHSIQDLHAKPTFNLVSAQSLLDTFRSMLVYCPCIVLPPDATVSQLSATRPFVLLAILAAASGSRTLQGHNLYDEEFRKVLALKVVAGGEQSIELLQGILVYCIWYPFHLRPKNKQVFQYIRMAADLIHDLELDQDQRIYDPQFENELTTEQMDGIRAYVAHCYFSSAFAVTWQAHRVGSAKFTDWTSYCCDVLERHSSGPGDAVLANLTRLGRTVCDAWDALQKANKTGSSTQSSLVLLGLESQFNNQQAAMHPDVASAAPIRLQTLFTKLFLSGGPVLRTLRPRPHHAHPDQHSSTEAPPPIAKVKSCLEAVRQFLNFMSSFPDATIAHFSAIDWGRLVLAVVVAMRLSFPSSESLGLDGAVVRAELDFGSFLDKMSEDAGLTASTKKVDIASAMRVVMAVVRDKYRQRLAQAEESALQQQQQQQKQQEQQRQQRKAGTGCPMLDGSMDELLPLWDASQFAVPVASAFESELGDGEPLYGDAWAAMAMGWTEFGEIGDDTIRL